MIADDLVLIREGLKKILRNAPDLVVVSEAQGSEETLDRAIHMQVDVVVPDISMPGKSGLEVLQDTKEQRPGLPVLILSMHPKDRFSKYNCVKRAGMPGEG